MRRKLTSRLPKNHYSVTIVNDDFITGNCNVTLENCDISMRHCDATVEHDDDAIENYGSIMGHCVVKMENCDVIMTPCYVTRRYWVVTIKHCIVTWKIVSSKASLMARHESLIPALSVGAHRIDPVPSWLKFREFKLYSCKIKQQDVWTKVWLLEDVWPKVWLLDVLPNT